eukprot:Hpha_TRINITY_DN14977_c4_g2::TRINITY_DN14977_c4_g2_i2::g.144517::m.144517
MAEGSVPVFLDALKELLSQGLINYIGVLCICAQPDHRPSRADGGAEEESEVSCWRGLSRLPPEAVKAQLQLQKGQFIGWVAPTSISVEKAVAKSFVKDKDTGFLFEL